VKFYTSVKIISTSVLFLKFCNVKIVAEFIVVGRMLYLKDF